MKNERIKIIHSPQSTSLADCKEVLGASALCSCKDVCVQSPPETDGG